LWLEKGKQMVDEGLEFHSQGSGWVRASPVPQATVDRSYYSDAITIIPQGGFDQEQA
jgi:hypothetical protein